MKITPSRNKREGYYMAGTKVGWCNVVPGTRGPWHRPNKRSGKGSGVVFQRMPWGTVFVSCTTGGKRNRLK